MNIMFVEDFENWDSRYTLYIFKDDFLFTIKNFHNTDDIDDYITCLSSKLTDSRYVFRFEIIDYHETKN